MENKEVEEDLIKIIGGKITRSTKEIKMVKDIENDERKRIKESQKDYIKKIKDHKNILNEELSEIKSENQMKNLSLINAIKSDDIDEIKKALKKLLNN